MKLECLYRLQPGETLIPVFWPKGILTLEDEEGDEDLNGEVRFNWPCGGI